MGFKLERKSVKDLPVGLTATGLVLLIWCRSKIWQAGLCPGIRPGQNYPVYPVNPESFD